MEIYLLAGMAFILVVSILYVCCTTFPEHLYIKSKSKFVMPDIRRTKERGWYIYEEDEDEDD